MSSVEMLSGEGLYDPWFEHDSCGIGFLVDIKGHKSHDILQNAIEILRNLEHRGACGCEKDTGDGAGILFQIPHAFFLDSSQDAGIEIPKPGDYGVGMVFLPTDPYERYHCEWMLEEVARREGLRTLGWRTVPVDESRIGHSAKATAPVVRQIFIQRSVELTADAFERKLYVVRKLVEKEVLQSKIRQKSFFYICSLSARTIVYKGMLKADQLLTFYPDLLDTSMETALAMVHSRFSTNTFPSWPRAHPYRYICHNGEINTLRGNVNWMRTRESMFRSELFGDDIKKIIPVIDETGSDSAMFDNALELLVMAGRSLPHSMMMMIPEPWRRDLLMSAEKREFYEYHSCLMEPWDGPASIAFTDGVRIGAILDRNGLRPSRYYVTKDGLVIMASEVGVLDVPPDKVAYKGRLQPGRMLLVDTSEGRIIADEELKHRIATEKLYGKWVRENLITLDDLPEPSWISPPDSGTLRIREVAFGYTTEDLKMILSPMAEFAVEPIGSMGNDAPLAVLSDRAQPLYNYFKQLFAQVTNPPVDAIREDLIMDIGTTIGPDGNLLEPVPESARQIELNSPILSNEELEKLRQLDGSKALSDTGIRFKTRTIRTLFPADEGPSALSRAMDGVFEECRKAIEEGCEILVLSDRGVDGKWAPIPALLAVAGVHHYLIRSGLRGSVGLVVESGEPREVHHFALLIGYGASAVNPYLAFETLNRLAREKKVVGISYEEAVEHYIKAVNKGVVKVMSKMGISTIQSYHGAQIFEAVGLSEEVVSRYFTGTPSRIGGIGLDVIAQEVLLRHERAFPSRSAGPVLLEEGGHYQWRHDGESHLFSPEVVHRLQYACRTNDFGKFKEYSRAVDEQSRKLFTLRGLFDFNYADEPVPLEEVESVESIVRRFKTGAMSYGSISKEAHEALAIAMNRIGGKSNTGEGGEDSDRYNRGPNGDSRSSAIKQVASGRFGVTSEYLVNAREIQIKMAQGAKPGEGGQLPGHKVYPEIARVRYSTPGVGLISPPPHHDIYSIEDLAELIHDLKNANRDARISVKLVAEVGVGTIAAGVAKAHADVILISGYDGGTGASPLTSIKHAGIPWELGLAETHQTLLMNDLRSRVILEVDGQLKTGRDVVIGALLGGEEFGFATAPLVVLGCVMMRVCHLNTCPVGIATQNPELRKKFMGNPDHVVNFMVMIAEEVRQLMSQLGFRTIDEMVGRTDRLKARPAVDHWKARGLDFSKIFHQPKVPGYVGRYCQIPQDHGLEESLDQTTLLEVCKRAIENGNAVSARLPIRNTNRAVGTILGSEITRKFGASGLADGTISLHFEGSAGQSFGAFVPRGITLTLEGDANDYLGKGLSGGKVIVYPPKAATFDPAENVIIGNVAFYGATSGEAYIRGMAGERFCVRNSGVHAVVEGVGDHGCEYMTGGRVVILGQVGKNFAAGMSGGLAYVLDPDERLPEMCNPEMVQLFALEDPDEVAAVKEMIRRHAELTRSQLAWQILGRWDEQVPSFVKVYPNDYRRVLEAQKANLKAGLTAEEAAMAAFEENARDVARVSGN